MSPPRSGRVPASRRARRDPEAVRERLYRVSLRRIRDQGYEAASVAGITREADVAKGTFFNHFSTKEHVLARYLEEVLNRVFPRAMASGGGTDAVVQALDDMGLELAGEPELARAVIPRWGLGGLPALPGADGDGSRGSAADQLHGWIVDRLAESLRLSVPLVEADDGMLAALLLGAFGFTLREWCHGQDAAAPFPRDRLRARLSYLIETAGFPPPAPL